MDRRRKILANSYEVATHEALHQAATKHGAQVFPKVRIADALAIQASGLTNEEYSYALKAHFDFIVAREDGAAAFAVEFDGPQHDREPKVIAADVLKNAICEKLGMPLLLIDAPFLVSSRKFAAGRIVERVGGGAERCA